nr:MAG TPA: hypothetical protein [Caudoviricetes sp.]
MPLKIHHNYMLHYRIRILEAEQYNLLSVL